MSVSKIKLNSADVKAFLLNDQAIAEILKDQASKIESNMSSASQSSRSRAQAERGDKATNGSSSVFNRVGEPHDRQSRHVGIRTENPYDFIYGTVHKAVESAGGKVTKVRKGKKRGGSK